MNEYEQQKSEDIFIAGGMNNSLRGHMGKAPTSFPSADELSEWIANLQAAWRGRLPLVNHEAEAVEEAEALFESLGSELGQCGTLAELAEVGNKINLCTPRLQANQVHALRLTFKNKRTELTPL